MRERRPGFRLAAAAVAMAAVVVVLGAFTRLADAGLGCPDWPGCYGFVGIPMAEETIAAAEQRYPDTPYEFAKAWPEMVHRYFAASLGLVIVAIAAVAWVRRGVPDQPLRLPLLLLGLVLLQGAFGAWTVTLKLWPQVVTAHLLGGFTILTLLWLLTLRLGWRVPAAEGEAGRRQRALVPLAAVALVFLVLQIGLGGWTSSNYAALACPDFPTCQGEWWPEADFAHGFDVLQEVGPNYLGGQLFGEGRVAIHLTHRIGALIVTLLLGALAWRLLSAPAVWGLRPFGLAVAAVLGTQVLLGIGNVVLSLPLVVATAHNAVGAALLLTVVSVNYRLLAATRTAGT
ncbi:MAG: COX15/CtaA family protein [Pseudomonadales bacterium]|jgi:cytochrome c oxidase assembly protein subunit 15|nr:COX15/CtaA family protein [Pseudomonadales bacterium]